MEQKRKMEDFDYDYLMFDHDEQVDELEVYWYMNENN